jgi:DNA-directed RNA polymerase subunit RPC12/RpoP
MINTINFTASLIKQRQSELRESLKNRKQVVKESACPVKKNTLIKEEDDMPEIDEEIDVNEKDVEVEEPAVEPVEEPAEVIEDGEGFEETIADTVHFCVQCNKHFLASPDTPDDEIVCPVCGEKEQIIDMGTAEEALDEEENADISIEDADIPAPEEAPAEEEVSAEEIDFDESGLEEGLRRLVKKHINERALLKIKKGSIQGNDLVLEGKMLPGRKTFKVTFKNIKEHLSNGTKKFVVEGHTDLFKANKLKGMFVREGNKLTIKKCGYGILKESKKGNIKVKGILG